MIYLSITIITSFGILPQSGDTSLIRIEYLSWDVERAFQLLLPYLYSICHSARRMFIMVGLQHNFFLVKQYHEYTYCLPDRSKPGDFACANARECQQMQNIFCKGYIAWRHFINWSLFLGKRLGMEGPLLNVVNLKLHNIHRTWISIPIAFKPPWKLNDLIARSL